MRPALQLLVWALIGQGLALIALLEQAFGLALCLHLCTGAAQCLSLRQNQELAPQARWGLGLLGILLPGFGPFFLALFSQNQAYKIGFLAHYRAYLEFQKQNDPVELLRREKEIREALRLRESWHSLIGENNGKEDKQFLLRQIQGAPAEKAVPLLQILRSDEDPEIAVPAAKLYFNYEQMQSQIINSLELQCELYPHNAHSWNQWSRALIEYARLGFPSSEQIDAYWQKALRALHRSLKCQPGQISCHIGLGRIYMQFEQYDKAQIELEKAKALEPHHAGVLAWLAELHYMRGQYQLTAQKLSEIPNNQGKIAEWNDFWQRTPHA